MPTPHVVAKVLLADPAANRFVDQLLAVLNPILRNVAGDLRGPVAAATVAGWMGRPLDPTMQSPGVGQVPTWNGSAWVPGAGGGGGVSAVNAAAPLTSTGGSTPTIGIGGTPAGGVAYATGATLGYTAAGLPGEVLTSGGSGPPVWAPAAAGTVTSVSVAAGSAAYASIANPTTTPELSLDVGTVAGSLADGGDSRFNPTPGTAGRIVYDNGTSWQALAPGANGDVLALAAGLPAWAPPSASFTGAGIGAYRATTTTGDTVALTDYVVDVTTTGAFVLNLPTAGGAVGQAANGRVFIVKNSGGAVVTVTPAGAQLIDGAATFVVQTQFAAFSFVSTGSGWVLV